MSSIIDIQRSLDYIKDKSKSQAGQDLFVIAMSGFKTGGTYLEIGCGHPIDGNNTWLLEMHSGWSGISLDQQTAYEYRYHSVKTPSWPPNPVRFSDLSKSIQEQSNKANTGLTDDLFDSSNWQSRPRSTWIKTDAMNFDYSTLSQYFDYLQIDLDHPFEHFQLLENLLQHYNKQFAIITFEHDVFTGTKESVTSQHESRLLLKKLGYEIIANNVTIEPEKGWSLNNTPIYFEDWWANPKFISRQIIEHFQYVDDGCHPKYYTDILFRRPL